MINILILLFLLILITNTYQRTEHFDGIGKGFAQFYFPKKCCKKDDCYPGMYVSNTFIQS